MTTMEGVQVVSLSLGYVMGQALRAAAELGIADALDDGPRTAEEVAADTGAHGPSMHRLLRTLASGGIVLQQDDGRFALTTLGETLRGNMPGSVRDAVRWVGDPMHYATCGDLAETVRSGEPAFPRLFGQGYFERLEADPEAARVWSEGMACFSGMENQPIARSYAWPPGARIVDVGGGHGGFLADVLDTDSSLRGVLYDRPEVITGAPARERCDPVAGDFLEHVPPGGDVYVLKRVLHDWEDKTCVALLRRCRDALAPGGCVLIIDAVIPPGNDPHPAKIIDMVMMGILPGRERTEAELAQMCSAAGLRLNRVIQTPSMLAIAEARPI